MQSLRKIVRIDEDKCDGCGLCLPACEEGALRIMDGKARLVSEAYCDGLGNCLAECPRGAITIEERKAAAFDLEAVERHLRQTAHHASCPGPDTSSVGGPGESEEPPAQGSKASELSNWPVQLRLAPITAPYFAGASLVIAADCVPFCFADFHRIFLSGRTLLVACPKLDDAEHYRRKLPQILAQNDIRSLDVVRVDVPCCFGLVQIVADAMARLEAPIPTTVTTIGINGDIRSSRPLEAEIDTAQT